VVAWHENEQCVLTPCASCLPAPLSGQTHEAGSESLAKEFAGLRGLDGKTLKECWRALYGIEPPVRVSTSLPVRRSRIGCRKGASVGGLKASTRRLLERVSQEATARRPTVIVPSRKPKPGTLL